MQVKVGGNRINQSITIYRGTGTGSKRIGSTSLPAAFRCTMPLILKGDGVMMNATTQPTGELSLRTVAMPADTNPAGDIFGGWIMSLMDLAAGVSAGTRAKGRVATAAVSNLSFLQPVKVGDVVCVYTDISKIGRTSVTVAVEAYVLRRNQGERVRVTAGECVLVAVDDQGVPRPLPAPEG